MIPRTMGQKIRWYREQNAWSKRHLARLMHVSHVTIVKWEQDQVNLSQARLQSLAELFGIAPGELFPATTQHHAAQPQEISPHACLMLQPIAH
jgi:transcriptional regulator with XRE-family HTH domain